MQYPERRELVLSDGVVVAMDKRPRKGPLVRLRAFLIIYMLPLWLAAFGGIYALATDDWAYGLMFVIFSFAVQAGEAVQYHNGFNDARRQATLALQEHANEMRAEASPERDIATVAVEAFAARVHADTGPLQERPSFHRSQMNLWTQPVMRINSFPINPPSSGYLTHARLSDLRVGDRVLKGRSLGSTVQTPPEPIGTAMLLRLRDDDTQQVSERILGADSVLIVGRNE